MEEADRVGTVLDTLMDIAEAESGSAKLEVSPQCLASVVDQVVESYAEFAEERGVHVTANVPPDLRVNADATSLSRVLANLLDNGIKYTPAEGSVRVTAERVDSFIKICIADSGVGIPADELPRVWDRLFRSKRCRSERGLGLGLSFVRALVEAHGGKAVAESELGTGTTVRISLPKA